MLISNTCTKFTIIFKVKIKKVNTLMASVYYSMIFCLFVSIITLIFSCFINPTEAVYHGYVPSPWTLAHATFYGDESASETMGT